MRSIVLVCCTVACCQKRHRPPFLNSLHTPLCKLDFLSLFSWTSRRISGFQTPEYSNWPLPHFRMQYCCCLQLIRPKLTPSSLQTSSSSETKRTLCIWVLSSLCLLFLNPCTSKRTIYIIIYGLSLSVSVYTTQVYYFCKPIILFTMP